MDDETLLRQAQRLDEEALAEVFDHYYVSIYRYIYHHIGHVETAEDVTGEVFQRLLSQLQDGRGPDHYLKAWLFRVASSATSP